MKTPLWDVVPIPSLLFDPDSQRARLLAADLRKEGLPIEVARSAESMLEGVRRKYFRTLVVSADIDDPDCLAFLEQLRKATPQSWLIALTRPVNRSETLKAYQHGVDAVAVLPASPADLRARIAALQLRARPGLY